MQRQYGLVDTLIYPNAGNSKYFYNGYTQEKNKFKEFKPYLPDGNLAVQQGITPTTFTIPIYADKLGAMQLEWVQGALTVTGGTYKAFSDYAALASIERINWKFGPNTVYTHYPEKKFWNVQKKYTEEKKDIELQLLGGDLSLVDRVALSATPQRFIYDIPFPWACAPDRYQELRQLAIAPVVEIVWRTLPYFVETDGTAPVSTVSECKLICYTVHLEPEERSMNNAIIESNHGVVRLSELSRPEYSAPTTSVPVSTTGEFQYPLLNYKTSLRWLAFALRPTADLNTALLNRRYEVDRMYGAPATVGAAPGVVRWRLITGAGEILLDWQYFLHNILQQHKMYFNSPAGAPIFAWYWDDNPLDECNASGAFNFQAVLNPILVIDFGSVATPYALSVCLLESEWQMIQTVRGEISPQFA